MKCRLCLKFSAKGIRIFNEKIDSISGLIELHYSIKISASDPISTEICQRCWKQTDMFHKLYLLVQHAQNQLNDLEKAEEFVIKLEPGEGEEFQSTGLLPIQGPATNENPLYEPQMDEKDEYFSSDNKDAITFNTPVDALTALADSSALPALTDALIKTESRKRRKMRRKIAVANEHTLETAEQSDISYSIDVDNNEEQFNYDGCADDDCNVGVTTSSKPRRRRARRVKFDVTDDELIKKHISFACELCAVLAGNFIELTEHFSEVHEDHNRGAYVRCCGKKLRKRCDIIQHAYKHEDPEYFKCNECNKVLSDRYTLNTHYVTTHGPKDKLKYACDQCDKKFSRPSHLEMHKPYHVPVEDRKFTCTQCPEVKTFASNHLLQVHKHMSHNRNANVCHVCAKVIRDKKCFEKHVRAHLGQLGPRVKCPLPGCDSWLQDEDNLKQHLRRHADGTERTYPCTECDRVCKSLRLLRSHYRYTHDKNTYVCSECKKSFKRALTLKEHMAQHSGDKLYKCTFCTRTFNSNANMYAHRKKMHPKEWDQSRKSKRGNQDESSVLPIVNKIDA